MSSDGETRAVHVISQTGISRPSEVAANPVSPQVLHVSWEKASGNPDKYRVKCRQKANPANMKDLYTEGPDDTYLMIEDLEPGMVYKVSVVSVLNTVESSEEPSGGTMVAMRMFECLVQKIC